MAGSITDLVSRVTDSNTGRPIIAALAAPGKALAAPSINLDAATNWTTTTAVHIAIYETMTVGSVTVKDASTQTDWKGTLSGVAVGNLTITGGTDRAYTAGAKVEITPTARYAKDLYDWALVGHNQNGTHKAFTESSIVPTAAIQDSAVTTAKVADGAITPVKSANAYKFRAYRNAAQSIAATTTGKVQFDAESFDGNNNFDSTTNNRYVAPVAGYYSFKAAVSATVDGGNLYFAALYKNGSIVSQGSATIGATGTANQTWTVSDDLQLSASDYIEVYFSNGSGGAKSLVTGSVNTHFSGHLISIT